MTWDNVSRVQLLQVLKRGDHAQCLRLQLGNMEEAAVIPGQYCLLGSQGQALQPCSYVSLPGGDGQFWVAVAKVGPFGALNDWLDYRGPLGTGWPLPLQGSRLLALACENGLFALAAAIDEIVCWAPWIKVGLVIDSASLACLPDKCRRWSKSLEALHEATQRMPLLERFKQQIDRMAPDLVYCSAPEHLAHRAAYLCVERGIPSTHIWLRSDRLPLPSLSRQWTGPVQRFDRLLAELDSRS